MESTLGKRLAAIEKKERDAAFRSLTAWIKEQPEDMSDFDLMKLWKALYYSFWLSDKMPVQQDLARKLAGLAKELPAKLGVRYINAFWQTMITEWYNLDRLRLDKYYYLFRQMHAAAFALLEAAEWNDEALDLFIQCLLEGPLNPTETRISDSLRYHTIEVFVEMLEQTVTSIVSPNVFTALMMPFIVMVGETKTKPVFDRVKEYVFDRLIQIVDAEIESEEAESEAESKDDASSEEAPAAAAEAEKAGDEEETADDTVLRSTPLQVYFPEILAVMFDVASHPETKAANRRRMYALVQEIKSRYNIELVDESDEDDEEEDNDESADGGARKRSRADAGLDSDDEDDEEADEEAANMVWEDLPSCSSDEEDSADFIPELIAEDDVAEEEEPMAVDENPAPAPTPAPAPIVKEQTKQNTRANGKTKRPKRESAAAAESRVSTGGADSPSSKSVQWRLDNNEVKFFNKTEPTSRVSSTGVEKEVFPAPELVAEPSAKIKKGKQAPTAPKKQKQQQQQQQPKAAAPAPAPANGKPKNAPAVIADSPKSKKKPAAKKPRRA
ncbi:hypothetical protein H9P43_008165 [Blastocladiella emersonii ATCC 22665]|nr:hypothetical protein H9P43_008165 [Blastocladiella emersonii ATCC 22665]